VLEGNLDGAQGEYVHDRFTDFALDFIRRHRERPFFLYLPYTLPHANYEPPDLEPYADEPWSQRERAYAAMVGRLDRDVGRIKARLDELGIGRNSLLIFASDNGAALCFEGVFDSCGPLRGRKRDLYEGGIRVPMIVCMPGHVPQGRTSALPCSFADIFPTLAEAAGVMPPDGLDGVSILPTFLGREQDLGERLLYWEFHENGFEQAGRIGSWKAVVHAEGQPELYDLATDVGETTDLAAENPDLVALFQSLLADAHVESPWWPTK
jgi:arylsulfatase A-like enzyme